MTVTELKKYIISQEKIQYILENIGCTNIKYHKSKEYFTCANKDGDNKTAIAVKSNDYINCDNYTRDIGDNSDLISLVMFNNNQTFSEAIKWLHKILGLQYIYEKKKEIIEKIDPLDVFKNVRKHKHKCNIFDFSVLDECVLYEYTPHIHIDWYREGIMPHTVKKFGLGYSYNRKRVIIPLRYWLTGQLLGTNARTTVENFESFDIQKYFITPNYPKLINLFGLWENYNSIQKAGYCIVYESEKSVLKRHSLLDETGVALSGHTISDEQIKILIGLNVDIIIALDNDIPVDEVRYMCSKFKGIRNVYYIHDKYNLLGKKDSPADAREKIFQYLYKYKIKY